MHLIVAVLMQIVVNTKLIVSKERIFICLIFCDNPSLLQQDYLMIIFRVYLIFRFFFLAVDD